MIVLALDTAQDACSVCVLDDDRVLAVISETMSRGHQERLAPMAAEAMAKAGQGFDALDRVGVTVGPGSFTGLRVGLAFAKGLSLALDIPCIGVGTLEALALGLDGRIASVIDAKRGQVYLQLFQDGAALTPPQVVTVEVATAQLENFWSKGRATLVGSGAALLGAVAAADVLPRPAPDPVALARLVRSRPATTARPAPLYLRAPDAKTIAERGAGAA